MIDYIADPIKKQKEREKAGKLLELISKFKEEYFTYFSDGAVRQTITQDFWYSIFLSRKRLKEKNLRLLFTRMKNKESDKSISYSFYEDGKNESAVFSEQMRLKKSFIREGGKSYTFDERVIGEYIIIDTQYASSPLFCPNCGAEQSLEQLLDGCDFCGTKYSMKDFKQKISAFEYRRNESAIFTSLTKKAILAYFVLQGLGFVGLFVMLAIKPILSIALMISIGIQLYFLGFCVVAGAIGGTLVYLLDRRKRQGSENAQNLILERMRLYNREFSSKQFLSGMGYKIKSIHFANTQEEINMFSQTNLSEYLEVYPDVIDCEIQKIEIRGYGESLEKSEQQLDVEAILCLTVDNEKKITRKKERVAFRAVTDKENRTHLYNETVIYTCPSCGTSVSLLEGGICQSCGTHLDLHKHDWVIDNYQSLSIHKLHKPLFPILIIVIGVIIILAAYVLPIIGVLYM